MSISQNDRAKLAQRILLLRDACAGAVTAELYAAPAACSVQFGDPGRAYCHKDLALHIQFLAAAIQAGSLRMFNDYLRWCDGVLASRGIECEPAAVTADRIAQHLGRMLAEPECAVLSNFFASDDMEDPDLPTTDEDNIPERLRTAREAYLSALLAAQRPAALTVAEECLRDGMTPVDVYVEVVAAALHRIGQLWESNHISVAQEHIATAITQLVISSLYPQISRTQRVRGHMIVTGVGGEMHQVGATILANALEASGWNVTFIGSDVPQRALIDTISKVRPEVLCISTTLASNLPTAAALIGQVRQRFGQELRILVGGAAFNRAPEAYIAELNVTRADLRGALRILCPEEYEAASVA